MVGQYEMKKETRIIYSLQILFGILLVMYMIIFHHEEGDKEWDIKSLIALIVFVIVSIYNFINELK